jgi:hypothetical protein
MMTKNQKIALGCGGAGCLGLIVVAVLCVVVYLKYAPSILANYNRNTNYNFNSNRNSNYNSNANDNENSNSSSSSISGDDKHKLFQAAAGTQDQALMRRVWEKLGLMKANGSPNDDYGPFVREHIGWMFKNADFLQSINTPEKARAYVDEHIND